MRKIAREECDTVDEVQKLFQGVFNDMELMNNKICDLEKAKSKKKSKKKGFTTMKNLMFMVISIVLVGLMLVSMSYSTVDTTEITFDNVTAGNFDQYLRGWFGTVNQDVVLASGAGTDGLKSGGTVYYVDGNKSTAGTGTGGWSNAFNTLSAAMAASHANIAVSARRAWASRNTIYVRADAITEDITALAQKTDIKAVGSDDAFEKALIIGTWIIPDTTQYPGCHFYNMKFYDDGAGGALWDVDTQSGLEFHGCVFNANATDTIGLQVEECQNLKLIGCEFSDQGTNGGFTTAAIQVVQDTDAIWNYRILGGYIRSDGIGIDWNETVAEGCVVNGVLFDTAGMWIDEEGDNLIVTNNTAITAVDTGTWTAGYDFSLAKSANNVQTGSGGETDEIPVRLQTGN